MFRKFLRVVVGFLAVVLTIVSVIRILGWEPGSEPEAPPVDPSSLSASPSSGGIRIARLDGTEVQISCQTNSENRFVLGVQGLPPESNRFGVEVRLTTPEGESKTQIVDVAVAQTSTATFLLTAPDHDYHGCAITAVQDGRRLIRVG